MIRSKDLYFMAPICGIAVDPENAHEQVLQVPQTDKNLKDPQKGGCNHHQLGGDPGDTV